jgi:hypothetical protein
VAAGAEAPSAAAVFEVIGSDLEIALAAAPMSKSLATELEGVGSRSGFAIVVVTS